LNYIDYEYKKALVEQVQAETENINRQNELLKWQALGEKLKVIEKQKELGLNLDDIQG
jgi:hypothetical protein